MKKLLALFLASALAFSLIACRAKPQDDTVSPEDDFFTVNVHNATKDLIKALGLTCYIGEESLSSTGMQAADGEFLGDTDISVPIYKTELPQGAGLSKFAVKFNITNGTGATYDLCSFFFSAEYGRSYDFELTFEDGAFQMLCLSDTDMRQNDFFNTDDSMPYGTITKDGEEIEVCIIVTDEGITFYRNDASQKIVAELPYPFSMQNAAAAFVGCDLADLDNDRNTDPAVSFTFSNGETANLLWFYIDGEYLYNEEFSYLPGEGSAKGE